MRQHVNPLSKFFQIPIEIPSPHELFLESNFPIHLDIGCARGQFLLELAAKDNTWNYLGLDIRSALIEAAEKERKNLGLSNLKYFFCNVNVSLHNWLVPLRVGHLKRVSIQFPDPWFKKRHFKRRVLQPSLINSIALSMEVGGELFIQSDVLNVFKEMVFIIESSGFFDGSGKDSKEICLDTNPYHILTEREKYAIDNQLNVYRKMFYRNKDNLLKDLLAKQG